MMPEQIKISVQSVRILESLSRGLHAAESSLRQVKDKQERERLGTLLLEMKKIVGGFFREHVDRRKTDRGSSPISDYEGYFLGKDSHPGVPAPACPFCGSSEVAFRRKDLSGSTHWYCTSCRQEIHVQVAE